MIQRFLLVASVVLAAACVPIVPGPVPGPDPDASCRASEMQYLVGQPEFVLAAMTFPAPTRIIEPGMVVTMDYQPNRLNIWIGENGRIERVTCG